MPQNLLESMASATETTPQRRTRNRVSHEPQYKVILHNDDHTPMEHVIRALQKVLPKMDERRATYVMLEAHTNGQAVVTKCHKELAEMYRDGLRSEKLVATIEPEE